MSKLYSFSKTQSTDLNNYEIVLFMQHGCHFCHHFDPKLREFAKELNISVGVFTLDGAGDDAFPDATPAREDIVDAMFSDLGVATPTTFLLNKETNDIELIAQGDMDIHEFQQRFNSAIAALETEEN